MYGISFGSKHSYNDWGLILTQTEISPPEPKRYTVEIPGRDGTIDLTSQIYTGTRYKNRTLKFTFQFALASMDFQTKLTTIMAYVHGQQMRVIEDVSTGWYWDAFCTVDSFKNDGKLGTLVIKCDAAPYKRKITETSYTATITGSGTVICTNSRMPVCPYVTVTGNEGTISITLRGKTWTRTGTCSGVPITQALQEGANVLTITGTATVYIYYREGNL